MMMTRATARLRGVAGFYFFLSLMQSGQNHFPRGLDVSPTHEKWNHSIGQSGLSQPTMSPYDT